MRYDIDCVILAGGKSSRMGRDKALITFGETSLSEFQYKRAEKLFKRVFISAKWEKFDFDPPLIKDAHATFSPLGAIVGVLERLEDAFFIPVDTPFLTKKEIAKIYSAYEEFPEFNAYIAQTSRLHPLVGIYKKNSLPLLREALKNNRHRMHEVIDKLNVLTVKFEDENPFFNINRPEHYEKAVKIAKGEEMVKHIVFMKFPSFELAHEAKKRLLSMKENIQELKEIEVGIDFSRSPRSYDLALITVFENKEALESYRVHPYHQKIVQWLKENDTQTKVVDYII